MKPILAILLSILLFALVHFLLPLQVSKTASDIQLSIEGRINHVLSSLDEGISNATITWQNFDEALLDKGVNLIRIDRGVISDWKHEVFVPDVQMLGSTDKWTYFKNPSFHYLSKIYAKDDKEVYAIIVWLRKEYKVNNRYLNNHLNKELFKHPVQLSEPGSVYQTIYYNANPIFGIQISGSVLPLKVNLQGLIAFVFATIIFLISLYLFYTSDHLRNSFYKLLVPLIGLLVLRVVLLSFAFPAILLNHPVADPAYFASSWLSPSIIDLFISLLFLFFMLLLLFPQFKNAAFLKSLKSLPFVGQLGIKVVFYLVLFFAGLFVWVNFQTIYHNSSISFDITNSIQFDWLRVLAFASIILAVAVFFILSHIIIQLSRLLVKAALPDLLSILIASFIFVAFNLYHKQYILFPFLITLIYFSVVYGLSLNRHLNKITFNSFLYFFSIIIFASLIGAYAIVHFEREDETELQRRFANEFLLDRDELAEFLLNEARYKIAADLFIQTRIASPFLSKESIRQKIKQVHLSKYFDKYNADVYLFNANGVSFDQSAAESLDQLMNRTKPLSQTTLFDHIYFISEPDRDVFKRYIALIPVERSNVLVGYILINLTLKRVIPDNVYPELLVDTRFLQPYRDRNFSYALWADDKIIYTSGQFNYTISNVSEIIGSELPSKMSIQLDEYLHAVVHDQEGRIAIVSSRWNPFAKGLANFSFMFLSYLGLLLLLIITLGIYSAVSGTKLNYAARIQLYLNMAFFLPLIIMSITVMSLMSGSFSTEQNEDYMQKARSLAIRIQQIWAENENAADQEELNQKILTTAALVNAELSIYDVGGKLYLSSQPQIYENHIKSAYLSPLAFKSIIQDADQAVVIGEQIGNLKFFNAYAGLKSTESGELIGVLSLPSFDSGYLLERSMTDFLANIMNVFTLLFLIFLFVSFVASKWLTFPLRFITQKLRRITLTEKNEPLVWSSNDEIGYMVAEYNRMLLNLERSKLQIERAQLESAWREIAQQVAHEIKNPLTPMKLSLQHLQHILQAENINKEKIAQMLKTLLKEVETLNGIASSFSSFAKMPKPIMNEVELNKLLSETVALYQQEEDTKITFESGIDDVIVVADEQLLRRILSNLILNALQSKVENKKVKILISLNKKDGGYLLSVRDNGMGIPDSMREKIFLPRFSTKQTGSGIGLAIARQGIESFNGKIWFESQLNKGTTFYVWLPEVITSQ